MIAVQVNVDRVRCIVLRVCSCPPGGPADTKGEPFAGRAQYGEHNHQDYSRRKMGNQWLEGKDFTQAPLTS